MKVDILEYSGFCGGVTKALYELDKVIKNNPGEKIYSLGQIVHNNQVNEKYMKLGVEFITEKDLDRLSDNSIIVVSAHGISDEMREKLKRFRVTDTTCAFVKKVKKIIEDNQALDILFIGKKNHSETIGLTHGYKNIKVIEKVEELERSFSFGLVLNQTTFNKTDLSRIHEVIKKQYPYYEIRNTTCMVSKRNQEFFDIKDPKYNICVIVGDKNSNNANSLKELSLYYPTYMVSTAEEIKGLKFVESDSVIIVGSASTSKDELKRVKNAIKHEQIVRKVQISEAIDKKLF